MYSTTFLTTFTVLVTSTLISAAPAELSTQITIPFPTGAQAITAAPPVPTFPTASSILASLASDAPLGSSSIVNSCSFPIYLYTCNQQSCGTEITVAPNKKWSAPLSSTQNDGVSIKIGTTPGEIQKPILQLEYTNSGGLVYFDASQINGNPFRDYGYTLDDSVGLKAYCAPPCTNCKGVYYSGEDGTVYAVSDTDSIGFTLCADAS